MRKRFKAPSPALVVSFVALFAALGGTSYAALANGSVGTAQLKNKAVTNAKLAPTSVGTAKIRSGAVGSNELGISTPSASVSVAGGARGTVSASCPSGTTILDGGGGFQGSDGAYLQSSAASGTNAWLVEGRNFNATARTLSVKAICIKP